MAQYKLTYFDLRARAEPLRYLFALADQKYEDVRVSPEGFAEMKPKLPYGQLPLLEYGDLKLSQSNTIGRFLSNKFGFHGVNAIEGAKIDEILDACGDYADSYGEYKKATDEKVKAEILKKINEAHTKKYFTKFSQVLEKNGGKFVVGLKVSYGDMVLYNTIKFCETITGQNLSKDYPTLQNFTKNFENLPKIRQWIETRPKTPF